MTAPPTPGPPGSGVREMLVIARREFVERVRSTWFVVVTLLAPFGMVGIVLVSALFLSGAEGARVEIVDRTGQLARPLAEALTLAKWRPEIIDPGTSDATELARIRDKQINGFLSIPPDALDSGQIVYRGDNGSSQIVQIVLRQVVQLVVQAARGVRAQIPEDRLAQVLRPIQFEAQHTTGKAEAASGQASFFLGYALAYVVLLAIMLYAVAVMRSVVQEKTSRVMELMVATVKPRSLMAGKILGVGTAGLVQVAVWLIMGLVTLTYRDQLLALFGKSASLGPALPSMTPADVAVALAFFLLGYFFYASMYAAVGAMVSSEQDTQQVQMPIMVLLLVGFAGVTAVGSDPRGVTSAVMTIVPFWSALLMPMRFLLGGAGPGEVALSLIVLAASTVLVARAAAKIYRVGVLMYGKRPSLSELVRWLRY